MRELEVTPGDRAAEGRSDEDEASLAQRAVKQDAAAWATIFERHYRSVFAYVRYRAGDAAEAEDLAAQTFEIAYTRAGRFDYRGAPIHAWLLGIARNLTRDAAKKRARRGFTAELDESTAPSVADRASAIDLQRDLAAASRGLTPDQQEVLVLRFVLDRSVEDTARVMKRSEDAIKNLQRRALAAMRRALIDAGYPGAKR